MYQHSLPTRTANTQQEWPCKEFVITLDVLCEEEEDGRQCLRCRTLHYMAFQHFNDTALLSKTRPTLASYAHGRSAACLQTCSSTQLSASPAGKTVRQEDMTQNSLHTVLTPSKVSSQPGIHAWVEDRLPGTVTNILPSLISSHAGCTSSPVIMPCSSKTA